jgi:hypothetical protein
VASVKRQRAEFCSKVPPRPLVVRFGDVRVDALRAQPTLLPLRSPPPSFSARSHLSLTSAWIHRMSAQCNLAVEAGNLVHFKQNFKDARSIRFPTPVEGFYHPLVLVESFEPGTHIERYTPCLLWLA